MNLAATINVVRVVRILAVSKKPDISMDQSMDWSMDTLSMDTLSLVMSY